MSVSSLPRVCGGNRCRVSVMAALLMLTAAVTASASEGQYWGRAGVSVGVAGSTFRLGLENRSEGGVADGYYASLAGGIERSLGEHLQIGVHYSRVDKRGGSGWSTEHRPYADAELRFRLSGLGVQDRNRLEVRFRDGDRALRYRNRFRLSHPIGDIGLSASVDDEVFVDLEDVELSKNRLTSGVEMRLGNGASLGVFHVFESSKTTDGWTGFHGLGASLSYRMKVQGRSSK
ncbi:MAG: DUF2490 domain-containing protein [Candidatus Eisenbacteria bacterium]